VRVARAAAVAVAVAGAVAAVAAVEDRELVAPSQPATAARSTTSVLAFPVGDRMPEGRWASACSLTCILPGVNETRIVMDTPFEIGADVCVAHVSNEAATMGPGNATLEANDLLFGAVKTMSTGRERSASRSPEPIVTYKPHAAQETTRPHCAAGSRLADGRPWWPSHPDLLPIAQDDVTDKQRQLVADEAMMFGALTMGRNVLGGSLHRQVGVYDLVAASVQRLGVCADLLCNSVVAVDTTRPSAPIARCVDGSAAGGGNGGDNATNTSPAQCATVNVNLPIITHLGRDGVERPVSMASAELLTLGRGMLGSPRWFSRAATSFNLGGQVTMSGPSRRVHHASRGLLSIQDGMESTKWDLNGTTQGIGGPYDGAKTNDFLPASPTSTPFLAQIATIFCAGKLRSFLSSPAACNGIRPWGRVRRPSASIEIEGNIMDAGVWAGAGKVEWKVNPTRLTPTTTGVASSSRSAQPYERRPWTQEDVPPSTADATAAGSSLQVTPPELAGRPSREVNPSSVIEAELAASLFQRQLALPAAVVAGHASSTSSDLDAAAAVSDLSGANIELTRELNRLSHMYDRRVFQKEHPAPPVSTADMVLAIVVVVPELGALLILLLTTERWGRAPLLGFFTIVILGGVSMSGVIALVSQEAAGAAWRARSTRTATHTVFPAGDPLDPRGEPTLVGTLVVIDESFLLLAPTTYRPLWVQQVAAVACGVYLVATAAMAARVLFGARQQRRAICAHALALPVVAEQAPARARWWWRPRARARAGAENGGSGIENDGGGGGITALAGAWSVSGVGAAFSASGVPPWPLSAGGGPLPRRAGADGGSDWV